MSEFESLCEEMGCDHEGNCNRMPTLDELNCCETCYLDHYYLNDKLHWRCDCKCHQVNLLHHCKKHKTHESTCKKCLWWTKAGKCQHKKQVDPNKLYAETLEYYLKKGDRTNEEYVKKANAMAQLVVERAVSEQNGDSL